MTIGVSACLVGVPCRYDGRSKPKEGLAALLEGHTVVRLCPEGAAKLPCPRPPAEQCRGGVFDQAGRDLTQAFRFGAAETLRLCRENGVTHAVLADKSPSCGVGLIYDGSFSGTLTPGDGLAAALLRENGIAVIGAAAFTAMTPDERRSWLKPV